MDLLELAEELSKRPVTGRGITMEVLERLRDEMAVEVWEKVPPEERSKEKETDCLSYEVFKGRVLKKDLLLEEKIEEAWERYDVILMAALTGRCTEPEVKEALKSWFFLVCEGRTACK